ncbi:type II secretion system secretin GspD [Paludibacterium yongneupense]|uniref:type II secretion system secretin GspD n=1 Tax=Paludibacterium yongneupense TaxID=400061 RepID=UPI0003FFFA5D|nr:type II secretion system secretin GspD [Paludibacterium yongneupense]
MIRIHRRTLSCLAAALVLACLARTVAAEPVMLNFVNADIETVVRAIGQITGKNFILDPRVKGTVNIVSAHPVPQELAYQIMLSSLRLQGFSAVSGRGVIKIVPEADAKLHAGMGSPHRNDGDRLITKVFILKNGNATQLLPVIRPIVSPNNVVSVFAQGNALVVTDYADNLNRIESILETVDSAIEGDTAVIPVQYGSAIELASILNKLMQDSSAGDGSGSGKVNIVADGRANLLLVRADTPSKVGKVKSLLKLIDQPGQAGANVRVIYLKNADAVRVAQALRSLLASDAGQLPTTVSRSASLPTSAAGAGQNSSSTGSSNGNMSSGSSSASSTAGAGGAATGAATTAVAEVAAGSAGSLIQADSANNALILNVPDAMYANLRNVIDLLDRRRAQVYVETLVMEVSATRIVDLGMQWQALGGLGSSGVSIVGGTNWTGQTSPSLGTINGSTTGYTTLSSSSGLNIGISKGTITIPGIGTVLNMAALASLLENEAQGNLLANPNIMATDNQPATIQVGQEVPILTGQYATSSSTSTATPFNTYSRQRIGYRLDITPQISEGGAIRMHIYQEAAAIAAGTASNSAGPTTNYRTIDTTVTVDDGGVIAIGGLIQDNDSVSEDKVPLLGDIPWLGWLFKHQNRTHTKTNLLVFLRPTIVRDDLGAMTIATDRYQYIIGESNRAATSKLPFDPAAVRNAMPGGLRTLLTPSMPAPLAPAPTTVPAPTPAPLAPGAVAP